MAALVALIAWIVLAANVGFAAGTGIECGWQPMPDGSASYECVVRVSPELLNSLRRGDSIPLTVDIPEHIRPIARIRLVAGEGILPHQALAQNLKSWPEAEKKSRDGIVETQFTTGNSDPRYASQQAINGAVVPLNEYAANAQDAFARQLQNGGQAVRNAVGQMTQDVLPPDPGRSVNNAIDRAGQELGNNLRSASDSVQNDIRQLFGNEPTSGDGSAILPPGGQQPAAINNQQSQAILPGDSSALGSNRRRLDQPLNPNPGSNWQSSQPQSSSSNGNTPISPPSNFDSQWAGDTRSQSAQPNSANPSPTGDRYNNAPPFTSAATVLPQNNTPAAGNQFERNGNAVQSVSADSRNGALGTPAVGAGPSFPPFSPSIGNEQSPITPTPMTSSSTPEIRRDMLSQPANADIQGANGLPIGQQPISATPVAAQASQTTANAASTNNFNWNTKPQTQATSVPQMAGPVGTTPNNVFPLLLSWVLLSGSGAGNLYLFWSYLDVRNKYRDLVDDASRRISGRRARD